MQPPLRGFVALAAPGDPVKRGQAQLVEIDDDAPTTRELLAMIQGLMRRVAQLETEKAARRAKMPKSTGRREIDDTMPLAMIEDLVANGTPAAVAIKNVARKSDGNFDRDWARYTYKFYKRHQELTRRRQRTPKS